jgi:hypothetical protein
MREASGRVVEDLPQENPFAAKPEPDPVEVETEAAPEPEPTPAADGTTRAFYAGHKTQESGPAAKKPWKLWKVSLDIPGKASVEAATFSETLGKVVEMLADGDEVSVLLEEGSKGLLLKDLDLVKEGGNQ